MGGLGSGRCKDRARKTVEWKTVESYRMLDINQLSAPVSADGLMLRRAVYKNSSSSTTPFTTSNGQ
jgi:hypothetical protein